MWQLLVARQCDQKALAAKFPTAANSVTVSDVAFSPKISHQ